MKACPRCRRHFPDQALVCPRHQLPLVFVEDPHLEQVLSGCRIEAFLGEGGMGMLYRARQLELGRPVALKILKAELTGHRDLRARFRAEAQAIARLKHPHIVDIIDLGETESGQLYFVLELLEGEDLHQRLRAGRLSVRITVSICRQVLSALAFAHRSGVVHRDLKPSNIFLASIGGYADWVKLLDFGVAKFQGLAAAMQTRAGTLLGTPGYMAPEQIAGRQVDQRSDIYSVGVMLFEICSGRMPFGEVEPAQLVVRQLNEPAPTLRLDPASGFPEQVIEVVRRCMARQPADRYPAVEELAQALGAALGTELDLGGSPPAEAPAPGAPPLSEVATTPRVLVAPSPLTAIDPVRRPQVIEHRAQLGQLAPARAPRRRLWMAAGLLAVVGLGLLSWSLRGGRRHQPERSAAPPVRSQPCHEEACVERARQALAGALEAGPMARVEALRAIGRLGLVALAPAAAARLQDPSLAVRCAAAETLGRLGLPAQRKLLGVALQGAPPLLSAYLEEALWRLGDPGALQRLERRLTDDHQAARVRAIQSLAGLGNRPALRLLEIEARASGRGDLALLSLKLEGRQDERAQQRLRDLLDSGEVSTRSAAAQALLEIGDQLIRDQLTTWMTQPPMRFEAARLLAHGGVSDGEAVLVERARGATAVLALRALARIPGQAARAAAEPALDSPEVEVRVAAAEAVLASSQELTSRSQLDWVRFALGSPVAEVRATATDLLALAPPDRSLPLLRQAIADQAPLVRSRAARVLGTSRTGPAVTLLEAATRDEVEAVREAAVRALGESSQAGAVPVLQRSLGEPGSIGVWAAASLLRLGHDQGLQVLHRAARGDDAARLAAALALAWTGSERAAPLLRELLRSRRTEVRVAAAAGLARLGERSGLGVLRLALVEGGEPGATAIGALSRLDYPLPELRDALRKLARAEEPSVRIAALRAVADSEPRLAVALLGAGLRDGQVVVRREAALGLNRADLGRAGEQLLLLALQDADAAVRAAAGLSLQRSGEKPAPRRIAAPPADADSSRKKDPLPAEALSGRRRQALLSRTTGEILVAQGRFDAALLAYRRAQKLDPRLEVDLEVGDLHRRRAAARDSDGDLRRAAASYRRAAERERGTPRGQRAAGMLQVVEDALLRRRPPVP